MLNIIQVVLKNVFTIVYFFTKRHCLLAVFTVVFPVTASRRGLKIAYGMLIKNEDQLTFYLAELKSNNYKLITKNYELMNFS